MSVTAVILAGMRAGGDPMAAAAGVTHKCLLPIGPPGEEQPMIDRVVQALLDTPVIARIAIVIEHPSICDDCPVVALAAASGRLSFIPAASSPSSSLRAALVQLESYPLLATTADHALLDRSMIETFLEASLESGADVTAALVESRTILKEFPEAKRTFWRFADGRFSGANLFCLTSPRALGAVAFWRRVERERKKPWRIARTFGPGNLVAYLSGRLTLDAALARVGRVMDVRVAPVILDFAHAAIDVDKPADLELVRAIVDKQISGA